MNILSTEDGQGKKAPRFEFYVREFADSTFGMTAEDYARLLIRTGFEHLVDDAVGAERFHAYGRRAGGILVTFDTFHRQRNSAAVQFRTRDQIDFGLAHLIEEIVGIDGNVAHVRLDARQNLLQSLAGFEADSGFIDLWGNHHAPGDLCEFALEQDGAVALREGVSPRDVSKRLEEVSTRRAEMLPKEWQYRWDIARTRSSDEARLIAETD